MCVMSRPTPGTQDSSPTHFIGFPVSYPEIKDALGAEYAGVSRLREKFCQFITLGWFTSLAQRQLFMLTTGLFASKLISPTNFVP
jgi:hypothetical protein